MNANEPVIPNGNPVFGIEVRGFDPIPEAERNMSLRQAAYLWVGTSVNLLPFALGVLAITLGLNLWQALAAGFVGNLTYAYVAFGSIATVRSGVPVSTLARAAFGMRGNLPNAALSWLASVAFEVINTIFGVDALLALFQLCGWEESGSTGKLTAVAVQLILCGGVAVLGHATVAWFQRIAAVLVTAPLLLMLCSTISRVDWAHAAIPHAQATSGSQFAVFLTAAALIASNPLSFLFNGPDWVRYLPCGTPARAIFHRVFWASFLPTVLLTLTGSWCATLGDMTDPVAGLKALMPGWLFSIYVVAVVIGSLASNVPTYYSSGLSLQAMGLRLHRYAATLLDVIVSTSVALYILFVQDFTTALNDFVALLVVWVGPYGGVWIADAILRRGVYDTRALHERTPGTGRYWGVGGLNPAGCLSLLAGMGVATLTMKSPLYDGPLAQALGGADLSWILGLPVSLLCYGFATQPEGVRSNIGM